MEDDKKSMESVILEKEAELHATQLAKVIVERAMGWFPLIREYKEGKVQEDSIKKKIVEDIVMLKSEMQARFTLMGESYETTLKHHSETELQRLKIQSRNEIEHLTSQYENLLKEQEEGLDTIVKRYLNLETHYILPILEKISENKNEKQSVESESDLESKFNADVHFEPENDADEEIHT